MEFESNWQAPGWSVGSEGSVKTEAGAGVGLSWVVVEVRAAEKGWRSWNTRKDERKAAFTWKEFWPQKAHEIEGQKWGL